MRTPFQAFPRMVYHKKNGSHIIVNNTDDLEIALRGNYQKYPLPVVSEPSTAEINDMRSKALDEREAALEEREKKIEEKERAKSAR